MFDNGATGPSHPQSEGRRERRGGGGSFIVDDGGTILGFDEEMESLTGWPAVEVVGKRAPLVLAVSGHTPSSTEAGGSRRLPSLAAPEAPSARIEVRLACRDGRSVDVEAQAGRLPGSGTRTTVRILRVLTLSGGAARPAAVDRSDEMTGLADRAACMDALESCVRQAGAAARPVALVLADVDHLRRINDRFGRAAGDEVLLKLAGILRAAVADESLVSRLGEDDFAVLLPGSGRGDARQFAARLRSTVERFRFFAAPRAEATARVTLTLGAASFPADADTGDDLLARAGEALDEARALGRNRVWCYLRRPRVPLRTPVYFDGARPLLVGFTRDLSPSGVFVETPVPIEIGMRCALSFPLPTAEGNVHVIGRVVRAVPPERPESVDSRAPGMGIEFERFGPEDRRAIDGFLHEREATTLRPETGILSV